MQRRKISVLSLAVATALGLYGCAMAPEPVAEPDPIITTKPGIDYSNTQPDCVTAGTRLAQNVTVGMPVGEVIRLVGKPVYRLPGSWWWSGSFSKAGKPHIQYDAISTNAEDAVVTKIISDTGNC